MFYPLNGCHFACSLWQVDKFFFLYRNISTSGEFFGRLPNMSRDVRQYSHRYFRYSSIQEIEERLFSADHSERQTSKYLLEVLTKYVQLREEPIEY